MAICAILIGVAIICLILLAFADCDLTLMFYDKFGKTPQEVLRGKLVWITGASSGIGEYLAYDLCQAGCKLVLSARRANELERVKKICVEKYGGVPDNIMILPLDLLDFDSHKEKFEQILSKYGYLDVLVNNSGRSQRSLAVDTSLEVEKQIMEINYYGTLSITRTVLPSMVARKRGQIVVTSSLAGKIPSPFSSAYSATKHALQGWFDTLRLEVAEHNIGVTMICPGPVESNIVQEAFVGKPNEKLSTPPGHSNTKRQATSRCSHLMAVAMANELDEVWISIQPFLFITYASQYIPAITKSISKKLGNRLIAKLRGHQQEAAPKQD